MCPKKTSSYNEYYIDECYTDGDEYEYIDEYDIEILSAEEEAYIPPQELWMIHGV